MSKVIFGGSLLSLSFPVIQITLQENNLPFKMGRRKILVKAFVLLYNGDGNKRKLLYLIEGTL